MVSRRTLLTGAGILGAGAAGAVGYRVWRDREPASPPLTDANGHVLWRNWSGIQNAYPAERAAPATEDELAALMRSAAAPIRPVGAGHSFTALVPTEGALVTLDRMTGLVSHDEAANTATVWAGTRLVDLGPALAAIGQEMPNLPDINKQSLAGGLGTGTHGTGRAFKAIHGQAQMLRIATPNGGIVECDSANNTDLFNAARVSLGAFGIVSQVRLQNQTLRRVHKHVEVRKLNDVMEEWPTLMGQHRNIEFYAVPFTGFAAVITVDETDAAVQPRGPDTDVETLLALKSLRDTLGYIPALRRAVAEAAFKDSPPEDAVDEGWKLLSNERPVRFNEMEFHLPLEAQMDALREVVEAIEKHRNDVFFPIECRVIDADDAWLSPFYQRVSGSIAVHAYYKDDYQFLFDLIEPIFRRHEGRPHWGKLHSLGASDFASLYPRFHDAAALRQEIDPQGRMLNAHLRKVFLNEQ